MPQLRKILPTQKALRACALARRAGSTKFGRPQKTRAFFGAPELRPRAGVICHRAITFMYIMHHGIKKPS